MKTIILIENLIKELYPLPIIFSNFLPYGYLIPLEISDTIHHDNVLDMESYIYYLETQ